MLFFDRGKLKLPEFAWKDSVSFVFEKGENYFVGENTGIVEA